MSCLSCFIPKIIAFYLHCLNSLKSKESPKWNDIQLVGTQKSKNSKLRRGFGFMVLRRNWSFLELHNNRNLHLVLGSMPCLREKSYILRTNCGPEKMAFALVQPITRANYAICGYQFLFKFCGIFDKY